MPKPMIPILMGSPAIGPEGGGGEALIFNVFRIESLACVLLTPLLAPAHQTLPTIGTPAIPFSRSLRDQLLLLSFDLSSDMTIWFWDLNYFFSMIEAQNKYLSAYDRGQKGQRLQ